VQVQGSARDHDPAVTHSSHHVFTHYVVGEGNRCIPGVLATAATGTSSVIARVLCAPVLRFPANDNADSAGDDRMLWEALRHFAEHGLHAAQEAAEAARVALEAGDEDGFEWWLSVCRMLDRPLSERLARQAAEKA
jgi:hypothetical protein